MNTHRRPSRLALAVTPLGSAHTAVMRLGSCSWGRGAQQEPVQQRSAHEITAEVHMATKAHNAVVTGCHRRSANEDYGTSCREGGWRFEGCLHKRYVPACAPVSEIAVVVSTGETQSGAQVLNDNKKQHTTWCGQGTKEVLLHQPCHNRRRRRLDHRPRVEMAEAPWTEW